MLHPSLPLPFQSVIGLSRYLGASNFFIVTSAAMYIVQPCYIIIFICYRYRLYSCTQPVLSLGILYSIKINFVNCCGLKFIGILYHGMKVLRNLAVHRGCPFDTDWIRDIQCCSSAIVCGSQKCLVLYPRIAPIRLVTAGFPT